ncbi:hypothetical protein [Streptomyces djakartensis]|uniref:hypothetical protein n=1 Tax=Streptomyces djakartensis TaxID=68193 RepID=UPI0034DE2034
MTAEQLPGAVREFANHLNGLLARLDPCGGWCAVFWQRDPEGMRACLDGREVPPWDVVDSLLGDLAAGYGPEVAAGESARLRALHTAATHACDSVPGARAVLRHRLDVLLRTQRAAAERRAALARRLAAAPTRDLADALARDLAWAEDDHERATARCEELRARMTDAGVYGGDEPTGEAGAAARAGGGPAGAADVYPRDGSGAAGVRPHVRGAEADAYGRGAHAGGLVPPRGSGGSAERAGAVARAGGGPAVAADVYPRDGGGAAGVRPPVRGAEADAYGRGAEAGGLVPQRGSGGSAEGAGAAARARGESVEDAEVPAHGRAAQAGGGPDGGAGDGARRPRGPSAGAGRGAQPRKRRRGSARFAGMAGEEGEAVAVPDAAGPGLPAPVPAGTRTPRGARFAGVVEEDLAQPRGETREELPAGVREEAGEVVAALARLRGEGRSGQAHALLAEAAHADPVRLPLLADELHRAGLAADWQTLLWEAACLPAGRLVAAADALTAAGRAEDGRQVLRQGVARPPDEIGRAVLGLLDAGRDREARALLDTYVRVRTPGEAARSAEPGPQRLVPLLLRAAGAVSDQRRRDVATALRTAGPPA